MLSEAEDEYAEMLLKAQPLLDAVSLSLDRPDLAAPLRQEPSSTTRRRTIHRPMKQQPPERERANARRVAQEQANDAAARRDAIRRAHARGPGANLEEAIRMIRAGDAMHGLARQ